MIKNDKKKDFHLFIYFILLNLIYDFLSGMISINNYNNNNNRKAQNNAISL